VEEVLDRIESPVYHRITGTEPAGEKTMRDTSIFKRRETKWNGGDTVTGDYLPKQPVTIGRCVDEEEDIWTVTDVNGKTHRVDGCELSPHPDSALTNEEFIVLVMNWSQTAMMQPFILLAVEEYAKEVIANGVADTPFMSGAMWEATAKEFLGWVAARDFVEKEKRKELTPAG
jgi:hypothetical protein